MVIFFLVICVIRIIIKRENLSFISSFFIKINITQNTHTHVEFKFNAKEQILQVHLTTRIIMRMTECEFMVCVSRYVSFYLCS